MRKLGEIVSGVSGRGVVVPGDDIDTDRIIPARFMKCVTFDGIGQYLFHHVRFGEDGSPKGHPLDRPDRAGASVLVTGRNFGCGSSREHAPQALLRFGIDAVIATSFAEIFFGNCTMLGLVCARVDDAAQAEIAAAVEADPLAVVRIDVPALTVSIGDRAWPFTLPASARDALLSGNWDPLRELQVRTDKVRAVASALPYAPFTGGLRA